MAVTIGDIAEKTGISPSAVSLALNGRPGVSEETRIRVRRAAERMGYQKHRRFPVNLTQNVRYMIFCEQGDVVKGTDFHALVMQGIESSAKELGFNVLVSYFDAKGNWEEQFSSLLNDVTGVIMLSTEVRDRDILEFSRSGLLQAELPFVMIDNATNIVEVDSVVSDNLGGAYAAASRLFSLGHPDVGYLKSRQRIDTFDEREQGFFKARKEAKVADFAKPMIIEVDISSEKAYRDIDRWLSEGGKPRSAFFADNDIIAASCVRALKAHGYRVPEDVSIIGFDDMPLCTLVDPPLTTIRIRKQQMGIMAMELLHSQLPEIRERHFSEFGRGACRVTVSTSLIERSSAIPYQKGGNVAKKD